MFVISSFPFISTLEDCINWLATVLQRFKLCLQIYYHDAHGSGSRRFPFSSWLTTSVTPASSKLQSRLEKIQDPTQTVVNKLENIDHKVENKAENIDDKVENQVDNINDKVNNQADDIEDKLDNIDEKVDYIPEDGGRNRQRLGWV